MADGYGFVLSAAITWADENGLTWDYDGASRSVVIPRNFEGFTYVIAVIHWGDDTLKMGITTPVVAITDELGVRRRIDPVMESELASCCFTLDASTPSVRWRDSVPFMHDEQCTPPVVDELFRLGHEAFKLLRLRLPDLFGVTEVDARLAQMTSCGSA